MPGPLGKRSRVTIGQLRHRLELQSPVTDPGRFRQPVPVRWDTEATLYGLVQLDQGKTDGGEMTRSGGTQANVIGSVTIRYRAGITPAKRLVWLKPDGNVTLNITSAPVAVGADNFVTVRVTSEA